MKETLKTEQTQQKVKEKKDHNLDHPVDLNSLPMVLNPVDHRRTLRLLLLFPPRRLFQNTIKRLWTTRVV